MDRLDVLDTDPARAKLLDSIDKLGLRYSLSLHCAIICLRDPSQRGSSHLLQSVLVDRRCGHVASDLVVVSL